MSGSSPKLLRPGDSVGIDSRSAAQTATQHLIELGRRRIGMIGGVPGRAGVKVPKLREQGFQEALEAAGIAFEPALIQRPHGSTLEDTAGAMARLLARPEPVEAVFCFNDTLALAAIRHLVAHGVRVPQDVAVIGIDDIQTGQVSTPTLSTISPDKDAIARTAVQMLVARIGPGPKQPSRHVTAPFTLIPRESTLGAA